MSITEIFPLDSLSRRERGTVFDLEGPASVVHRMREIGIREGATIEMVRPGQPCLVCIDNRRISIRCQDCQILVSRQVVGGEAGL